MNDRRRAIWAVAIAAMLVGTTGTAQALYASGATPMGVGAARALVGGLAMVAIARGLAPDIIGRHPQLVLVGSVGVATYQPAFFVGVDRLGVALGTVLAIGSGPAFAGLLAWALGRPPSRWWVYGTAISVLSGAAMVWLWQGSDTASFEPIGVIAALGAGFGYALYTTTTNLLSDRGVDATKALAWQFVLGSLALIVVFFVEPMAWLATGRGVALALYLGVVTIGVAYALVGFAVPRLGAPLVTTMFQVEPVTAAVLSVVVLGERLPPQCWVAAAGVLVGVQVATRPSGRIGGVSPP